MQKSMEQEHLMELMKWLSERKVSFLTGFIKNRNFKTDYKSSYRAWFDGSYRQLEGVASVSYYIADNKGRIVQQYAESFVVSQYGAIMAESKAFSLLMNHIVENKIDNIVIYGDCEHIVEKDGYDIIESFEEKSPRNIKLIWIPRYLNFYADELCTYAYSLNTIYENKNETPISQIFNKQNFSLVKNLLKENIIKDKLYLKKEIILHRSLLSALSLKTKNEYYQNENEKNENEGFYLFSFDGTDNFINISVYQAVRLMEQKIVTIISKDILMTSYPSSKLITFANPLNLARWVLKNNNYPEGEDHLRNVKDQTVYLIINKGLNCISITTKQAKELIVKGLAKIFAEDVLVSKLSETELKIFDNLIAI